MYLSAVRISKDYQGLRRTRRRSPGGVQSSRDTVASGERASMCLCDFNVSLQESTTRYYSEDVSAEIIDGKQAIISA